MAGSPRNATPLASGYGNIRCSATPRPGVEAPDRARLGGARGLLEVAGDEFTVTATEQISGRLDAKAVREFLGDAYHHFENAVVSTVIRIKPVNRLAAAA